MQWLVRSQDGKLIIPIESVEAVTVNGKHIVRGGGRVLGEYATEERSIEIITDMADFIDYLCTDPQSTTHSYKMPTE